MNILRTITADKRFLYNVVYTDDGFIDTLGIHMLEVTPTAIVWSPSIPLCTFPKGELDLIISTLELGIKRIISQA